MGNQLYIIQRANPIKDQTRSDGERERERTQRGSSVQEKVLRGGGNMKKI